MTVVSPPTLSATLARLAWHTAAAMFSRQFMLRAARSALRPCHGVASATGLQSPGFAGAPLAGSAAAGSAAGRLLRPSVSNGRLALRTAPGSGSAFASKTPAQKLLNFDNAVDNFDLEYGDLEWRRWMFRFHRMPTPEYVMPVLLLLGRMASKARRAQRAASEGGEDLSDDMTALQTLCRAYNVNSEAEVLNVNSAFQTMAPNAWMLIAFVKGALKQHPTELPAIILELCQHSDVFGKEETANLDVLFRICQQVDSDVSKSFLATFGSQMANMAGADVSGEVLEYFKRMRQIPVVPLRNLRLPMYRLVYASGGRTNGDASATADANVEADIDVDGDAEVDEQWTDALMYWRQPYSVYEPCQWLIEKRTALMKQADTPLPPADTKTDFPVVATESCFASQWCYVSSMAMIQGFWGAFCATGDSHYVDRVLLACGALCTWAEETSVPDEDVEIPPGFHGLPPSIRSTPWIWTMFQGARVDRLFAQPMAAAIPEVAADLQWIPPTARPVPADLRDEADEDAHRRYIDAAYYHTGRSACESLFMAVREVPGVLGVVEGFAMQHRQALSATEKPLGLERRPLPGPAGLTDAEKQAQEQAELAAAGWVLKQLLPGLRYMAETTEGFRK